MANIPRSLSGLQYVSSESSTRTSADDFGHLTSLSSADIPKLRRNQSHTKEKFQQEIVTTPGLAPISSSHGESFSSDYIQKNPTSFCLSDPRQYPDKLSNTSFHKEFHSSAQPPRQNSSTQHAMPICSQDSGGGLTEFNPSVELPLMASFPQNPSSFSKTSDRNPCRMPLESEPSSFLRMRVQNLQQRIPNRTSPDAETTKYNTTPIGSRSEDSSYFPFYDKRDKSYTLDTQCHSSDANHSISLKYSDLFVGTNNPLHKPSTSGDPGRPTPHTDPRAKLSAIQDKIVRFEGQLQVETQQKKVAEENKLQVLRESINTVEKTLHAEVRRRLETVKSIQAGFENQLQTLQTRVERSIGEKQRQISEGVESIASRLQAAERRVDAFHDAQNATVQKLTEDIEQATHHIRTLKDHLDNELKARRQREAILLDRLTDVEKQLESRIALERGIREKDILQLKCNLDGIHDNHIALDDAFQQSLANTFHELKTSLQQEAEAREQADDDIVQALNHYTAALQGALSITNST